MEDNKFKFGDTVAVTDAIKIIMTDAHGKDFPMNDRVGKVLLGYRDHNREYRYVVDFQEFAESLRESDLELIESAKPVKGESAQESSISDWTTKFAGFYPLLSQKYRGYIFGYIFKINNILVAAKSIEEAIDIFRKQNPTVPVESVVLLSKDVAIIQNDFSYEEDNV